MLLLLSRILLKKSKFIIIFSIISGIISSIISVVILEVISRVLSHLHDNYFGLLIIFLLIIVIYLISNFLSLNMLSRISEGIVCQLRLSLSKAILDYPLRKIELLGSAKIYASLTEDIQKIGQALYILPNIVMQITTIISGIIYSAFYSIYLAISLALIFIISLTVVKSILKKVQNYFIIARRANNEVFKCFNILVKDENKSDKEISFL